MGEQHDRQRRVAPGERQRQVLALAVAEAAAVVVDPGEREGRAVALEP